MPKKMTLTEWKQASHRKHNNFYDYSCVEFETVHDYVRILCPVHGFFEQKAYSHKQGKGCTDCSYENISKKKSKSIEQFIKDANRIHNNRYDYSSSDYKGKDIKLSVRCIKHGPWMVTPGNHINNKSGCPDCYYEATTERQTGAKRPGIGGVSGKTLMNFVKDAIKVHGEKYDYSSVDYVKSRKKIVIKCNTHGEFEQLPSAHLQGQGCRLCSFENGSKAEKELIEILSSWGFDVETNNRTIIAPKELDIVIHERKLAIEFCGLYWHCENSGRRNKMYHKEKQSKTLLEGYRLITIFEDEWRFKKEIVLSRLRYIVGLGEQGKGARDIEIKEISWKIAKEFLDTYHIQGSGNSGNIRYGAFLKGDLVGVMTFSKPRIAMGRKHGYPELLRFATDGKNYPGLASKMFTSFVRKKHPLGVISYADLRWSDGNLYMKMGFRRDKRTDPNYWYTKDYKKREHRFRYRKSIVTSQMGGDKNKTEWENMKNFGYDRIWDCGNLKFVWESKSGNDVMPKDQGSFKLGMVGRKPWNTERFVNEATKVHGKTYNYSMTNYINARTKVKIGCIDHGIFEQLPSPHLRGQGCNKCNLEKRKKVRSHE